LRTAVLYLVTDDRLPAPELLERLDRALLAGVRVVQFRDKSLERGAFLQTATEVQGLCLRRGALFIVNDAADVAALLDADGLHLGQEDLPPGLARQLVGPDALIGLSVSAIEEARSAERDRQVDYLGVGAMYRTETKPDAEYGGCTLLRQVRTAVELPLVAIGGITVDRAPAVWAAGADLLAVVSAVFGAADPARAVIDLLSSRPT
jgi:thiamine-phosphate pyrophosphorylase